MLPAVIAASRYVIESSRNMKSRTERHPCPPTSPFGGRNWALREASLFCRVREHTNVRPGTERAPRNPARHRAPSRSREVADWATSLPSDIAVWWKELGAREASLFCRVENVRTYDAAPSARVTLAPLPLIVPGTENAGNGSAYRSSVATDCPHHRSSHPRCPNPAECHFYYLCAITRTAKGIIQAQLKTTARILEPDFALRIAVDSEVSSHRLPGDLLWQ